MTIHFLIFTHFKLKSKDTEIPGNLKRLKKTENGQLIDVKTGKNMKEKRGKRKKGNVGANAGNNIEETLSFFAKKWYNGLKSKVEMKNRDGGFGSRGHRAERMERH